MSTTIAATGDFVYEADRPKLTISGGRGNTDQPETHLEWVDADTGSTIAWFDTAELVAAISAHYPAGQGGRIRLSEPAAAE